jgi:hypothetical protein
MVELSTIGTEQSTGEKKEDGSSLVLTVVLCAGYSEE